MSETRLERIHVTGFRSLGDAALEPAAVTVLIGPNGSGKSNVLSALKMTSLMRTQSLRRFVSDQGGASRLLHYGATATPELTVELAFSSAKESSTYSARLGPSDEDSLVFLEESAVWGDPSGPPTRISLGAGHTESKLTARAAEANQPILKAVETLVGRMGFFHFHDTSKGSPLRQVARRADDRYLRSDGSNLAAFLYRLKAGGGDEARAAWEQVRALVGRVAPFVKELCPELVRNEPSAVRLHWVDEKDHRFDANDFSDGVLRALALITALSQPAVSRPHFVTIDKPELGLGPAALEVVLSLVRTITPRSQVLLATQSATVAECFRAQEVVVTERAQGVTSLRRLSPDELTVWLKRYRRAGGLELQR